MDRAVLPETLARIDGLELKARTILASYFSGRHQGSRRGSSLEFAEHRDYTPGDDPRHIDWKIFGKRDRFTVKQYESDAQLTCWLLLDVSRSMTYRGPSAKLSKAEYGIYLAAALSCFVLNQQDAVGLGTYDRELHDLLPPSSQPGQLRRLLLALEKWEQQLAASAAAVSNNSHPEGSSVPPLMTWAERFRKPGVVILLSDCLGGSTALRAALQRLHFGRHDVRLLQILDPAEEDFPFEEVTRFQGLEGEGVELLDAGALRAAYRAEFQREARELQLFTKGLEVQQTVIRTNEPFDEVLARCLRTGP